MITKCVVSTAGKNQEELTKDLGPYHYLHTILEETPNGVLVVGNDHRVIHGNPSATRFLSLSTTDFSTHKIQDIFGQGNIDLFHLIEDHLENNQDGSGSKIRHEIEFGEVGRRVILRVVVVFPPDKKEYYLLYLIDVTQQKKLERELRRSNTFFHNLIDSSVDGIIAADMKGKIILFNQGAQSLLGYDDKDIAALHVTGLYNEGGAYELIQRMRGDDYGGKGRLLRHEFYVKHKNGNDIPVSFSGGIIYDRGQEIATFGLFTDLRAMQEIEENLEVTHEKLMQSEKMAGLGRLAAGVAHEINNPMSGIMLYANLVKEELGGDHTAHKDLDTIVHEAERCKVIVADLLEFSHQTIYEMEPVNLNDVIHKTLTILQHQPLFHNIEIIQNLDNDLPPVYGNSIRLNQVVMNIIVNGAQAMNGSGKVRIISRTRANSDINEILIEDNGPGIEKELQEKIFDPFFTTKETGEGTGLGLSVSYAIIKEHKGSIRVLSEPEKGTTFTIKLPVLLESLIGGDDG